MVMALWAMGVAAAAIAVMVTIEMAMVGFVVVVMGMVMPLQVFVVVVFVMRGDSGRCGGNNFLWCDGGLSGVCMYKGRDGDGLP